MSDIHHLIASLETLAPEPNRGLPEPLFLMVSRLTPLVGIDLLVRDSAGRTLLTWRHDEFYGPGWHVPGGILRHGERMAERIYEVARLELGADVDFEQSALSVTELLRQNTAGRGHIVSLLYRCRLLDKPDARLRFDPNIPKPGHWHWHEGCPDNLIEEQRPYERYLQRIIT
jgi:ADP-ribose pyrophosphatase YjhB (NUDIX family)